MIEKYFISTGIQYVEIKDVDLRIQCGTPMDSIKQLKAKGFLKQSEIEGYFYEKGPNAILLSDLATQNGHFSNLSEFPILHMIYKQGMGIPGHPIMKQGIVPILIGSEEQIEAQEEYIFWGKTGICNKEAMRKSGFSGDLLEDHWRLKVFFNSGRVSCSREDILSRVVVDKEPREIRSGVYIKRIALNIFEISYKGSLVQVDLNLKKNEVYELPFDLGYRGIRQEYFSIVNCGDGNGWDSKRTCMGSVITFQDKIFLVDAGPHIDKILTSLGICIGQIEGVFQTHAHDDHFAGLSFLFQMGKKINYYATKQVRLTVQKKFTALLGGEAHFTDFFAVHDLPLEKWADVQGLHVKPCYSPHPVETTIFYFRAVSEKGNFTYGHLADIVSKANLDLALKTTSKREGISQKLYDRVWKNYLMKCDLKKIDCGEGFVHGNALDFKDDKSDNIIISHTDWDPKESESEIGSPDPFGTQRVLIKSRIDYLDRTARRFIESHFPSIHHEDAELLINCERETFPPGKVLISPQKKSDHLYLILSGFIEFIDSTYDIHSFRSVGSLLGEKEKLLEKSLSGSYRTGCYVTALKIPTKLFHRLRENKVYYESLSRQLKHQFLLNYTHLGYIYEQTDQKSLCGELELCEFTNNFSIEKSGKYLYYLFEGEIDLYYGDIKVEEITQGTPFFLPNLKGQPFDSHSGSVMAKPKKSKATCFRLSCSHIEKHPVILWQMGELFKYRKKIIEGR